MTDTTSSLQSGNRKNQREAEREGKPQGEKLQKVLARSGCGSRREMERAIEQGRLKINGRLAHLGDRVGLTDRVELDNKTIAFSTGDSE